MLRAVPLALALLLIGLIVWSPTPDDAAPVTAELTAASTDGAVLQGRANRTGEQAANSTGAEQPAPPARHRVAAPPSKPRRIQVRVVRGTPDGPPIEGVPIHRGETLRPLSDAPDDEPLGFTDFEGRVTVEVPGGIEIVHARGGPDYLPWAIGWVGRDPEGPTIVLRPARRLTGRVRGVPTDQRRTIYMHTRWSNPDSAGGDASSVGWGRLTKDGRFTVLVPADALDVRLFAMPAGAWRPDAHGLKSYAGTFVKPSDAGPFLLDFRDPTAVSGEVVGIDGTKITHGSVSFHPLDRPPLNGTSATLNNTGTNRFTLAGLAPGRYRVTAHSIQPGWASPVPRIVTLPLKGELRVEMPPATQIRGQVAGVIDTKNVYVEWWHRAGPKEPYDIQARTPLSDTSSFALTNIADGDTLLRVIRGHTVLADLTHVRVPADDVVVRVEKAKR